MIDLVQATINLERERLGRLEGFFKAFVDHFGWGGSLEMDLDEFCTIAEEHGLIEWKTYDPADWPEDMREIMEAEEGDPIWVVR